MASFASLNRHKSACAPPSKRRENLDTLAEPTQLSDGSRETSRRRAAHDCNEGWKSQHCIIAGQRHGDTLRRSHLAQLDRADGTSSRSDDAGVTSERR
jgi:hypothetical protein